MYKGMLDLFEYTAELVKARQQRDSLTIVAYHNLCKVLESTERAMHHYFTLSLEERFLQNSHLGTPYQKWAHGTNDNFKRVVRQVRHLVSIIEQLYGDHMNNPIEICNDAMCNDGCKIGHIWFSALRKGYKCCVINCDKPLLTLYDVSLKERLKPDSIQFLSRNVSITDLRVIPTTEYAIDDRSVLRTLQAAGINQTEKMRQSLASLAVWLGEHIAIQDMLRLSEPRRTVCGIPTRL